MEIQLGNQVESIVSGIEGIATAKSTCLNGSIQFCIRPKGQDTTGNSKKATWVDIQTVKKIDDGLVGVVDMPELSKTNIGLGMQVEHFNGFTGIVSEKLEYMNGCVYFNIMPDVGKDNNMPEVQFIACQYLKIINDQPIVTELDDNGGPESSAPTM